MIELSNEEFEKIVADAMDSMPDRYIKNMENVAFVIEDLPSPEQRHKLMLRGNQTLFGLYEGIPLTKRGAGYNLVLPDKITIFKRPLEVFAHDLPMLKRQVRHTVWHEIAHHFGLDHKRIHEVEEELGIQPDY
jgi:predicted Zn-dependent protease with MMP-like domain